MSGRCPYHTMDETALWSKAVARALPDMIDPMIDAPFTIGQQDKIATGGSCFAQHIARYLALSGYNYFVAEDCPAPIPAAVRAKYGYGVFSARYGNIYSARQLLQTFLRAFDQFDPVDDVWHGSRGRLIDPYRPFIQPGGFSSEDAFSNARAVHLEAVRRMFLECDIFVFTMGLTEGWVNARDGAAYPVCPGCGAGSFNENEHLFVNADYPSVMEDMQEFLRRLAGVNPKAKVILTVSPVPLVATASGQHVAVATTYSKAVLRAAAGALAAQNGHVAYFPAYEIITGNFTKGAYYAEDLRTVKEEGVAHVMRTFFRHFTEAGSEGPVAGGNAAAKSTIDVVCDEEMIEA